MDNIKKFEEFGFPALNSGSPSSPFLKNYGEEYDLSKIQVGQEVVYAGTCYYVVQNNQTSISLSKTPDGEVYKTVTADMFNQRGVVRKN